MKRISVGIAAAALLLVPTAGAAPQPELSQARILSLARDAAKANGDAKPVLIWSANRHAVTL